MIGPVQNTSLPLEPVRQQLTPHSPAVTEPPQPLPMGQLPLPASTTNKDKFGAKDGEKSNDEEADRNQRQQQYEANRELASAWSRLTTLQQIAREALGAGDGPQAKEAAIEAAAVAASIRDMADALPGISVSIIDIPAAIDNARSGVDVALQVVEAMAGVEAVAAELLPAPQRLSVTNSAKLDLRA